MYTFYGCKNLKEISGMVKLLFKDFVTGFLYRLSKFELSMNY